MGELATVTDTDNYRIAARLERLPASRWHNKLRFTIGCVNFWDAFDALTITYVLPALIPLWHMRPAEIGALISIGYAGQIVGGLVSGWLAERYGRVPLLTGNLVLFPLVSLACMAAQTYSVLMALRFLQGVGLGGEVPIANAYISEFANSEHRARFVLVQQTMFPLGLTMVALFGTFVVPLWGWRSMFVLGTLPILLLPFVTALPESPRWMASRGYEKAADQVLTKIEMAVSQNGARPLPHIPDRVRPTLARKGRFRELFQPGLLGRTLSLWLLCSCTYLLTYAISGWLPSIMRSVFHQSVAVSNLHGFILNVAGLLGVVFAAFTLDRFGRKRSFSLSFLIGSIPLFAIALQKGLGPIAILTLATISFGITSIVPAAFGMFAAENYPNHLRAIGVGSASIPQRTASAIGPYLVGLILPVYGVSGVFAMFAAVAVIGGLTSLFLCTETAGRTLEDLALPSQGREETLPTVPVRSEALDK